MNYSRFYALAIAVVLVGCQSFVSPATAPSELDIFTEQVTYEVLERSEKDAPKEMPGVLDPADVVVHVVNEGAEVVHFEVPGPYKRLDKKVDGEWRDQGLWYGWIAVAPRLEELAPGEAFTTSISRTEDQVREPGTYRFRFKIYDKSGTQLIPAEQRVSNAFEVVKDASGDL